jgi:hypothetical protein
MVNGALCGFIELKAPGKGADPTVYTGRDRKQWHRLSPLPNLLYTDGNAWSLYRHGDRRGDIVTLAGDVRSSGSDLRVSGNDLTLLFSDFLSWDAIRPSSVIALAREVAGICRLLRAEVRDVLDAEKQEVDEAGSRPFTQLADDWRDLLFPTADDDRFADSYAQTVTFALLLACSEGVDVGDFATAAARLSKRHGLLGRALQILTDPEAQTHVITSLSVIQRVLAAVDWNRLTRSGKQALPGMEATLGRSDSPWLTFYEDFLTFYDPVLRKDAGAYYTPNEVVATQVRLVNHLLRSYFSKPLGFAADDVITLDPAMGSGSYLIRTITEAAATVSAREGEPALPARLRALADRVIGFEIMTGAFAVAELQVSEALRRESVPIPEMGLRLYLADTLDDPYVEETRLGGVYEPIARSRRAANRVKQNERVVVCIGNPPYDRHHPGKRIGGWVRYGSPGGGEPILDAFRSPAIKPGHITSLYNLYVYFWRWALWKVFEAHEDAPGGVVAYITSSSFLAGPGFAAMREYLRRIADDIWVIDLGGDQRGPRDEENIFDIQVPVAITICARRGSESLDTPARVNYTRLQGSRREKLAQVDAISTFADVEWKSAPTGWSDPLAPSFDDEWSSLPALLDLIPWRAAGAKLKRTWPIAPSREVLAERWRTLALADPESRKDLFKEDVHRDLHSRAAPLPGQPTPSPRTLAGENISPCPNIVRYGYRSFDRQWILADSRLMGQPSTGLWAAHSDKQVHLVTLHAVGLENGPAVSATSLIPDLNYFRGNSTGAVLPLWRDPAGKEPNIAPGLLDYLGSIYRQDVNAEGLFAYVAAVLGHSGYTARYSTELATPGPRVPLTADPDLFTEAVRLGGEVLWCHCYGDRYSDPSTGRPAADIPPGRARVLRPIPMDNIAAETSFDASQGVIQIGDGAIGPVSDRIWAYEVSGMHVVEKWLGYRRRKPAGRKSSPLDSIVATTWPAEWTSELLALLWILAQLFRVGAEQADAR